MPIPRFSPGQTNGLIELMDTPIVGKLLLLVFMLLPPIIFSFLFQWLFGLVQLPLGFTEIMLFFLPTWNYALSKAGLQLMFIGIPAWAFWGIISLIKMLGYLLFNWPI